MFYNNTASLSYSDSERRTNNNSTVHTIVSELFTYFTSKNITLSKISVMENGNLKGMI